MVTVVTAGGVGVVGVVAAVVTPGGGGCGPLCQPDRHPVTFGISLSRASSSPSHPSWA